MSTAFVITPEIGVPFEKTEPYVDLRERAHAACNTAIDLSKYGLDVTPTEEDNELATLLASTYAEDPIAASKKISNTRAARMRPASLVLVGSILDEFGQAVVENSLHIRHLVTNKLLLESDNPDARVRLRALEMLGKISDVGLFVEKREVTVHQSSTEELKEVLKEKLSKLIAQDSPANNREPVADAEFSEVPEDGGGEVRAGYDHYNPRIDTVDVDSMLVDTDTDSNDEEKGD